jgi:hypothetical protein
MYLAIRDYYAGAFESRRWIFEEDLPDLDLNFDLTTTNTTTDTPYGNNNGFLATDSSSIQARARETKAGIDRGQEIWLRFRLALRLLDRPNIIEDLDTGKKKDFAEGVRLMRLSFADLSQNIMAGREAPMLLFWLMRTFFCCICRILSFATSLSSSRALSDKSTI